MNKSNEIKDSPKPATNPRHASSTDVLFSAHTSEYAGKSACLEEPNWNSEGLYNPVCVLWACATNRSSYLNTAEENNIFLYY